MHRMLNTLASKRSRKLRAITLLTARVGLTPNAVSKRDYNITALASV